jgi:hypothetical protein
LLRRPDGCKLDINFSAQWRVRTEMHVVWKDDAWYVWRPDGMKHRPNGWNRGQMSFRKGWHDRLDGWQGTDFFDLSRSAESSESALNSGILVYNIFLRSLSYLMDLYLLSQLFVLW